MDARIILIFLLKFLQLAQQLCAHPIQNSDDVQLHDLNRHLRLHAKRLELVSQMEDRLEPQHIAALEKLIQSYRLALKIPDFASKNAYIDRIEKQIDPKINDHLQLLIDEQFVDESIRVLLYYFRGSLDNLGEQTKQEVLGMIEQYEKALAARDYDEKYNIFTDVEEKHEYVFHVLIYEGVDVEFALTLEFLKYILNEHAEYMSNEQRHLIEQNIEEFENELALKTDRNNRNRMLKELDSEDNEIAELLDELFEDFQMYKFGI